MQLQEIVDQILEANSDDCAQCPLYSDTVVYVSKNVTKSYDARNIHNRAFILHRNSCLISVIFSNKNNKFERKTVYLTPQPISCPISILVSQCASFLIILTPTSAHIADLLKLESAIQSTQNKIVGKLSTVYDNSSENIGEHSHLIRARWHPKINNVLVILNEDGFLLFFTCKYSQNSNININRSLGFSVFQNVNDDKFGFIGEDISSQKKYNSTKLNINLAMGMVCCDFDFGSPIFSTENKVSCESPLYIPLYVLCENGDIVMVSASPSSLNQPLIRVVRILPEMEDYYSFDFNAIVCMWSLVDVNQPDVLCIGNQAGKIFHGIILHVPSSALMQSGDKHKERSLPILYLIDTVDLNLNLLSKTSKLDHLTKKKSQILSKLTLIPEHLSCISGSRKVVFPNMYLCIHKFGIHSITLPWIRLLNHELLTKKYCEKSSEYANLLHGRVCTIEHLVFTQNVCNDTAEMDDSSIINHRSVIGLLPLGHMINDASTETKNPTQNSNFVLALFLSKPYTVKICLSNNTFPYTLPMTNQTTCENSQTLDHSSTTLLHSNSKESDFVSNMRRTLSTNDGSRLPIMSTITVEKKLSETEFIRLFVKLTNTLRISRLSRISSLCSSVNQFSNTTESQIAAQYEEVAFLAEERDKLHKKASLLTNRHSKILERQEALNHRLSELSRRIYSIEAGLTDAEISMRSDVHKLRDRLKSVILNWFKDIRFQYDNLTNQLEKVNRKDMIDKCTKQTTPRSRNSLPTEDFSSTQVGVIVDALKEEGFELDVLVKTIEKLKVLPSSVFE